MLTVTGTPVNDTAAGVACVGSSYVAESTPVIVATSALAPQLTQSVAYPPLRVIAEQLRVELTTSGSVEQVVSAACDAVGLDPAEGSLLERAHRCHTAQGSAVETHASARAGTEL